MRLSMTDSWIAGICPLGSFGAVGTMPYRKGKRWHMEFLT
jgi:hypothetical protein